MSLSTLEKALSGQRSFTEQTLIRIEQALDMKLRPLAEPKEDMAPDWLGSYARPAVRPLEGAYLTLRPAASGKDTIYAYRTEIYWDAGPSHLSFRERDRLDGDYAQSGAVSVPHQTGHIYLVTNRHGQYRMALLSRPLIRGEMFGVLVTLQTGRGSQLVPVATPLALIPMREGMGEHPLGSIDPSHSHHATYVTILNRATVEDFARLLTLAAPARPSPP